MPSLEQLLAELEQRKTRFDSESASRVPELLRRVEKTPVRDTSSLIRLHEALLFLRAFPHTAEVFRRAGSLLDHFVARVDKLRALGVDLTPLDPLEVSGISGTTIEDALSYDVVHWLAARFPEHTQIVWDGYEEERLMANTWPRFLPLLEEDSAVEANVPWHEWLRAGAGSRNDLAWFLRRFDRLSLSPREKSELYDGLQMVVRWTLSNLKASRTRNWRTPRHVFYHHGPLIQRRDISLADAFAAPPLKLQKLSLRAGEDIINLIHEVMAVRYRELYGTTLGD